MLGNPSVKVSVSVNVSVSVSVSYSVSVGASDCVSVSIQAHAPYVLLRLVLGWGGWGRAVLGYAQAVLLSNPQGFQVF